MKKKRNEEELRQAHTIGTVLNDCYEKLIESCKTLDIESAPYEKILKVCRKKMADLACELEAMEDMVRAVREDLKHGFDINEKWIDEELKLLSGSGNSNEDASQLDEDENSNA